MSKKRKEYITNDQRSSKKRKIAIEETTEERNQRRLNKRLQKQEKTRDNEMKNYFGYRNDDNPFNDPNLTTPFTWEKKYDKHGLTNKEIKNIQKGKIRHNKQGITSEISKVKERRKQREKEEELKEKLRAELAKEMELEENVGWKEKEQEFHQTNAIKRSQMRIMENRYTPIDILAINIMQFEIHNKHYNKIQNPIQLINNLTFEELALLLKEINMYISDHLIGTNNKQMKHWNYILLYTQYTFDKKHLIENYTNMDIENDNNKDINDMNIMDKIERENLSKKSYNELIEFEEYCEKMATGKAYEIDEMYANISIDMHYWTLALKIAKICKAKAFVLKEFEMYMKTLEINTDLKPIDNIAISENKPMFSIPELKQKEINENDIPMIDKNDSMYKMYTKKAIDYDEYLDEIEEFRIKILKQSIEKLNKQSNDNKQKLKDKEMDKREDEMYNKMAIIENESGEHSYNNSEQIIPSELMKKYLWHDKYRPRKPRYFNKVKTGYAWNKYNQTHYDPDNPPPKIVQGYKFNIFYPDLIDPSQTPKYKLYEKDNNNEYAVLIFKSGPPYQDIAFKIVNNEWESSQRRGFRCRFEKGIFSLYFNFKRYRYRR